MSTESSTPPEGLFYFPNFITHSEEIMLLTEINKLEWQTVKMHGITAKRRVMHFGMDYSYNNRNITPTIPIPDFLQTVVEKSAKLMQILPNEIIEALITEYPVGAGIGWHKDAAIFGEKVFGISLGGNCLLKLRLVENDETHVYKCKLASRSAYLLSSYARTKWQHSIPPVKQIRYSITFRTLKK